MWVDGTGLNAQTFPRGTIQIVENLTPLPSLEEMLLELELENAE